MTEQKREEPFREDASADDEGQDHRSRQRH